MNPPVPRNQDCGTGTSAGRSPLSFSFDQNRGGITVFMVSTERTTSSRLLHPGITVATALCFRPILVCHDG